MRFIHDLVQGASAENAVEARGERLAAQVLGEALEA
jgi:hypothetical protein